MPRRRQTCATCFYRIRISQALDAAQVDESEDIDFPLKSLDGVIMNAPFTDNAKRGRKYTKDVLKQMQAHELGIRDTLGRRDNARGSRHHDKQHQHLLYTTGRADL